MGNSAKHNTDQNYPGLMNTYTVHLCKSAKPTLHIKTAFKRCIQYLCKTGFSTLHRKSTIRANRATLCKSLAIFYYSVSNRAMFYFFLQNQLHICTFFDKSHYTQSMDSFSCAKVCAKVCAKLKHKCTFIKLKLSQL